MPIGPLSEAELLIIFIIILLILGPTKLPLLARSLGDAIREFRKAASGVVEDKTSTAPTRKGEEEEKNEKR